MKMHKLSLVAALALGSLLAGTILVSAQEAAPGKKGGRGMMSVEQRLERMTTQLSLTDEQKPKIKAVLEETTKKMQALAPEERREKGRAIREEEMTKFKAILTPEQFEKYQKQMEQYRQRGPGGEKKEGEKKKAD